MKKNNIIVSSLIGLILTGNAFAASAICKVYVNQKEEATREIQLGWASNPAFVSGENKEGKKRTFRVWANILRSGVTNLVIADNDRSVDRGGWFGVPILAQTEVPFTDTLNVKLTYGDPQDADPLIEMECKAK